MAQPVIKRRGQLTETSPEEVSKLSMAINRPMAPTTPMETGAIGGTPAQAKMAGTPAQTRATLRAEITEKDDLSTRLRQRQPRRQATAEEQAQIEEGRRLEQLRGLGGRVQQLAEQAVIPEETAEAELDVAEEVDPDTAALVRAVQENPEDQQALINLSNKLAEQGKIPAGQVASTEQISQLFGDKQQAISRALGEAVPEEIVLTDADYQELGFADSGELASLLGVPAEQLAGMDVQQLTEQINAELTDEFDKVEDLTRKANDPYLGPAERAAVRSELRDLGAVGIRTLESDIDTLADQIEQADTVEFAGEQVDIGELLDDDYMSGVVANYLEDPDVFGRKLKDSNPELADWIDKNTSVLENAVGQLDEGVKELSKRQTENAELARTGVGEISDELMKSVIGEDWGALTGRNFKEELESGAIRSPALSYLSDNTMNEATRQALLDNVNTAAKVAPEFAKEVMGLPIDQLKRIGALGTGPNAGKFKDWLTVRKAAENVDYSNPDDIINVVSPGKSRGEFISDVREIQKKINSGLFPEESLQQMADELGLSSPQKVKSALALNPINFFGKLLKRSTNQESLSELVGKMPENPIDLFNKFDNIKKQGNDLYNIVETGFSATDNTLDDKELKDIISDKKLDIDTLIELEDSPELSKKMTPEAKSELSKAIATIDNERLQEALGPEFDKLNKTLVGPTVRDDSAEFKDAKERMEGYKTILTAELGAATRPSQKKSLRALLDKLDSEWTVFADRAEEARIIPEREAAKAEVARQPFGTAAIALPGSARAKAGQLTKRELRELEEIEPLDIKDADFDKTTFVPGMGLSLE